MQCLTVFRKFQVVDSLQKWSRKDGLLSVFYGKKGQLIKQLYKETVLHC